MSALRGTNGARSARSGFGVSASERGERRAAQRRAPRDLIGRDFASDGRRWRVPIWLIPGLVVGGVFAALAIAHVRVELIGQGYRRYSAVERLQALEEERRTLTARVRELRDPARLAAQAEKLGFSQPERVINLAPPQREPRP
jgi:hypothetical protein